MISGPFLLLAGPTAVGKSEIALLLAEQRKGEIISVDSMQVYRGMDIGTAKPSVAERARVPHHLIDVLDITASFDVARFVQLALAATAEIQARGRLPILCGGTGLYFKALLDGLGEAPPADPGLRAKLREVPFSELLHELAALDPETYQRIDRQNPRRVIRALEVIRLTGKPLSQQRTQWSQSSPSLPHASWGYVLSRPEADLRRRIDRRVEAMFRQGLVEETAALRKGGLEQNITASLALGYRQVLEHLDGVKSLAETIALVKARTRQYAKRQMTWFRGQHPFTWITIQPEELAGQVAGRITELMNRQEAVPK